MNILPLIFAVLLILGLFANVQYENYKRFYAVKKEYVNYMKNNEHQIFNRRQRDLYLAEGRDENRKVSQSHRRLNALFLLDENFRNKNSEIAKQHELIAKELIKILYQNCDFYKELEEDRPDFLEELMDELRVAGKQYNPMHFGVFSKLDLRDKELQHAFYLILVGHQRDRLNERSDVKAEIDLEEEENHIQIDDPEDFQSLEGKVSFKDFLHFNPKRTLIQIYSAPLELLQAIFINKEAAEKIIEVREEIYLALRQRKIDADIAKQKLTEVEARLKPGIQKELLDFSTSDIDPRDYR